MNYLFLLKHLCKVADIRLKKRVPKDSCKLYFSIESKPNKIDNFHKIVGCVLINNVIICQSAHGYTLPIKKNEILKLKNKIALDIIERAFFSGIFGMKIMQENCGGITNYVVNNSKNKI